MAKLEFKRNLDWINLVSSCSIYLDNEYLDSISSGGVVKHEISNGPHIIKAKMSFMVSNELNINVNDNEVKSITINQSKWNYLIILIFIVIVSLKFSDINFGVWMAISIVLLFFNYFLNRNKLLKIN